MLFLEREDKFREQKFIVYCWLKIFSAYIFSRDCRLLLFSWVSNFCRFAAKNLLQTSSFDIFLSFRKLFRVIFILDPTHADCTTLEFSKKISKFPHTRQDSGIALIRAFAKLEISAKDELRVVTGPGNFTAVRTASSIGNAVKFVIGCRLFSRKKNEKNFHEVETLQPFYGCEPSISFSPKIKQWKRVLDVFSKLPEACFWFSQA